jgi:hypothetical protein
MRHASALLAAVLLLATAPHVHALETRILEVRAVGPMVRATVELGDVFSEKFREVLSAGGALHIRVQAELWEDRPLWDRVVRPALVTVFRIVRDPTTSRIAISDAVGAVQSGVGLPNPLSLRVDVAPTESVSIDGRYYLRLLATVGTLAEKDIEEAGDAAFGADDGSVTVGRMGRMIFRAVLQATDYLQSESSEATSSKMGGRDLLGTRP